MEPQETGAHLIRLRLTRGADLAPMLMDSLKGGGLFLPGVTDLSLGEPLFLVIELSEGNVTEAALTRVVWIAGDDCAPPFDPGCGVQFGDSDASLYERLVALLPEQTAAIERPAI